MTRYSELARLRRQLWVLAALAGHCWTFDELASVWEHYAATLRIIRELEAPR